MTPVAEPLHRLPARPLSEVLSDLESRQSRRRQGLVEQMPVLTLHLLGGHILEADFLAYRSDDPATLLVSIRGGERKRSVAYVPLPSLLAVVVHHDEATLLSATLVPTTES